MSPRPDAVLSRGKSVHSTRGNFRRRPNPEQGRALEVLGHSIEYMIDSYVAMHSPGHPGTKADVEAVRILISMNRLIFSECEVVVPLHIRILRWLGLTVPSIAGLGCFIRR